MTGPTGRPSFWPLWKYTQKIAQAASDRRDTSFPWAEHSSLSPFSLVLVVHNGFDELARKTLTL